MKRLIVRRSRILMCCPKEKSRSDITVNMDMYDIVIYYAVGLQLAELSSIPRSVVDDAKNIAELVQRQIHVIYYALSINTHSF